MRRATTFANEKQMKPKKKMGRPRIGKDVAETVAVRIPPDVRKAIEAWAKQQEDKPSLSEAIRRILAEYVGMK
jgi:uncharacterized protein (DUF4415 family)